MPDDSFDEVSISDEKSAKRQVRINAARLVIVNWDAANGDYICGSDDTFMYFITRQDRRDALLQSGGTILCEFQSGRGQPYQAAYDAIFGAAQVEVVEAIIPAEPKPGNPDESKWNNSRVHTFTKYREFHPITKQLGPSLDSRYTETGPLFNFNEARPQETFYWYKYRKSLYNGWFTAWEKGWVPLLIADLRYPSSRFLRWLDPPPAVLLAKCQDRGLMLASTMWIAGSRCTDLVESVLRVDVEKVRKAHARIRWERRISDLLLGGALCLAALLSAKYFPNLRGNLLSDLGLFWSSLILFRVWLHLVWRRPYGVSVFQFVRRGFRAFWETI